MVSAPIDHKFTADSMATDDKYDRQLRLWGPHGQRALMHSHMLLINAEAVGTETMKNLVLPGIGQFSVMDDKLVTEADCGCNFFVTTESIGKPRAEVCCELLCEMNEDVTGKAIVGNYRDVIMNETSCQSLLSDKTFVVAANLDKDVLLKLSSMCWNMNIPMVIARAYGMIGYVRLQAYRHSIIEGKPDGKLWDLRIANSFPALEAHCEAIDVDKLDIIEHSHLPFVVILYYAKKIFLEKKGDSAYKITRKDKAELLDIIREMSNNYYPATPFGDEAARLDFENNQRGIANELNFQEAMEQVHKIWSPRELSGDMQRVLSEEAESPGVDNAYSIFIQALALFMQQNNGDCPLSGAIPDMISNSNSYIALQKCYETKAGEDNAMFRSLVEKVCNDTSYTGPVITTEQIDLFCKHLFDSQRITLRSMSDEYVKFNMDEVSMAVQYEQYSDAKQTPVLYYFMLRAVDEFFLKNGRYPGTNGANGGNPTSTVLQMPSATMESDAAQLWELTQQLLVDNEMDMTILPESMFSKDHAVEMTRYGRMELHNIAAVVGGISAQEAVKIITHQFVPMDNTYIYNGVAAVGARMTL